MKLYHEQAWVVPGKQGRGAERVDVPNSPPELAAWLNERRVSPVPYEEQLERDRATPFDDMNDEEIASLRVDLIKAPSADKNPGHCAACGRSAEGTLKLQLGNDLDELAAWLDRIDAGNLWALQRAAELIRGRVRDLGGRIDEGGRA